MDYTGIDLSGKLIEEARIRYPGADFAVKDILKDPLGRKFDYVIASGTLSYKTSEHEVYIEKMLGKMMEMSTQGVAVNL